MDEKLKRPIKFQLAPVFSGLEGPFVLLTISAGASVWLSYDRIPALIFFTRILLSAGLFFFVIKSSHNLQKSAALGFLILAASFAIYWTLTNDYASNPGEIIWITTIGNWLNTLLPLAYGSGLQANHAAGTLLVSVPFGIVLSYQTWEQKKNYLIIVTFAATAFILMGLLLTDSLGAWISLAGTGFIAGLVFVQRRWFKAIESKRLFWAAVAGAALLLVFILILLGNLNKFAGEIPDPGGYMRSRTALWAEGMRLAQDYFFTGSGLASFRMNHAAYAVLTHVPFIAQSHNIFVEVWVEQGVLGALAIIWGFIVVLRWAWKALDQSNVPTLAWAGLSALCAAGVHGMVEVVFYGEPAMPVIGLILGYASLAAPPLHTSQARPLASHRSVLKNVALLIVGLFCVFAIFRRPLIAGWYANLGALEQSQVELGQFDPEDYDNPSLEQIRRRSNLQRSEALFQQALAIQPTNITALRRLSLIALAKGDYANAIAWMETAWSSGYRDSTTRLIFGDALVADGRQALAAEIMRDISWAGNRLAGQGWWRYWNRGDYTRAGYAWKTAMSLDPRITNAAGWLVKAKALLEP